jgi:glycosyltransferase involved in cell wall biosynthesis
MKLLVFFTYGVSLKQWHDKGLLQREVRLYQELINQYEIKVGFITYGNETDFEYKDLIGDIEIIPIYSFIKKPKNKFLQILQSVLFPWRLKGHLENSDIYKTNQMLGSWVSVISKILYRKQLIVRCGYELFDFALKANKNFLYKSFVYFISWFSYKNANIIHVATSQDKGFVMNQFKIKSNKIRIFPNWIDISKYKPYRKTHKKDSILFVGRLNRQKNISLLLHSLVGTNIPLDIVGTGELEASLRKEATDLGVTVKFLGNIANNKMPEIYNDYQVYVLCSYYEGNPKTLLEAMSCGCAVIGTDVPGIREIISHEKNGLLVLEDKKYLRIQISRLYHDKSLSTDLGNQAVKYIEANNSLENAVINEMQSYHSVVTEVS